MTREELIDKYREINVDDLWDQWYDGVYDDFTARMAETGIGVGKIHFTGFWSQGDGACFVGRMDDPIRFLDTYKWELPTLRQLLHLGGELRFRIYHYGRYYHENCARSDFDYDWFTDVMPSEDHGLEWDVACLLDEKLKHELDDFEDEVMNVLRQDMRELYCDLRKEYDRLTSDEAVWDTMVLHGITEELDEAA